MNGPDVTVVIPVYNTMPYLRRCLDSVLTQTIGSSRLQVVAVDDGSTDGSAELLDEMAGLHPEVLAVFHQPNSGGPASPCNRGLDHARGRWVFFLGADDYLAPTALSRLVEQGDAWGSDVIFGTMAGENGRFVDQRIYRRTAAEVTFADPGLAYSLSNTKLFRRSLLEEHHIRYALDLRVGSDQPFVVEALTRARRISVLTDQVYYHAVRRADAANISYSTAWQTRLQDVAAIIRHIADVVEPGPLREAILARHFTMELGKLIRLDLLGLDRDERDRLLDGLGELISDFWTAGLRDRLGVLARLRIELASSRQIDLLRDVVTYHAALEGSPPLVLRSGAGFVWYPGFGDRSTDPQWYALHRENLTKRLATSLRVDQVTLRGSSLRLRGRLGVTAESGGCIRLALLPLVAGARPPAARRYHDTDIPAATIWYPVRLSQGDAGQPAAFEAEVDLAFLVAHATESECRHALRLQISVGADHYDLPLPWSRSLRVVIGPLLRSVAVTARAGRAGLLLSTRRMPVRAVLRRRLRQLSAPTRRLPLQRRRDHDLSKGNH